jgi:hydrocephalus-inducing protein
VDLPIAATIKKICDLAKKLVPEPIWPDPDKEPLPPPVTHSIVKPPPNRKERPAVTLFSIWTPKDGIVAEEGAESTALPEMQNTQSRWILQPKDVKKLYVKFFSKTIGNFDQTLQFEIVGSYKPFNLNLNALCEFPTINSNFKNVFMAQKKSRPAHPPESYLSKTYVVSEGLFDFGPLLIGKDSEKRNTDELVKKVNSYVFKITNNGKYEVNATFCLKSSLPQEEGGIGEKSPFIIEPETMDLNIDETKDLTVYAFPHEARLFKDEVICLLKDNPNPVIFNV